MARAVLRRDRGDGNWRLVCDRAREAEVYRENARLDIWPQAEEFPMPLFCIASDPDSDIPSAPGHACRALRDERDWAYECVPETGHFLQIQEPEICAGLTRNFVRQLAL